MWQCTCGSRAASPLDTRHAGLGARLEEGARGGDRVPRGKRCSMKAAHTCPEAEGGRHRRRSLFDSCKSIYKLSNMLHKRSMLPKSTKQSAPSRLRQATVYAVLEYRTLRAPPGDLRVPCVPIQTDT